jgi:hypothetical protein
MARQRTVARNVGPGTKAWQELDKQDREREKAEATFPTNSNLKGKLPEGLGHFLREMDLVV